MGFVVWVSTSQIHHECLKMLQKYYIYRLLQAAHHQDSQARRQSREASQAQAASQAMEEAFFWVMAMSWPCIDVDVTCQKNVCPLFKYRYPLVMTNIAMENG